MMTDNFDRTPGAGRVRGKPTSPGLGEVFSPPHPEIGDGDAKSSIFNQCEPLRQPRTSPPLLEGSASGGGDCRRPTKTKSNSTQTPNSSSTALKSHNSDDVVGNSKLSVNAAEFFPSTSTYTYEDLDYEDDDEGYYPPSTLAELVQEILSHLNSSPGSFEFDIDNITATLNEWVTAEVTLVELVELIYTQSTSIPNFAYTGARLCNHLSHNLALSPASGNFRQLLLKRCRTEYEQRDQAVRGNEETQKSFHSYVLFLGELYLNLEVKSAKGPPSRAVILLAALKDLLIALFSKPVDGNLICAVKLLKLTGSVLEDAWKENGKSDMDEVIQKIENVVLDATCSRDVKQMLLRLVELRSSNWGRVLSASASNEATPDNDPNYFMNEPTFYTADGTPFTAADPDYSEKYQEILDREGYDDYEENGNDDFDSDDEEMDPEIEEAFEKFCLESERKKKS
ncbi:polyadenylate-binding protein-interacting protein 1 isoform X2 [Clupea harengus]|uniref:Polyadenylate-binding protein-interacting protein 1 n=1 Tax=Clupea harengus TaxID=7950 RepID=A0A6P3W0E4_CLUHA|nr:polyadenylate-binding protein-interacting protein 1 isoform X2 [Clupea harengus]